MKRFLTCLLISVFLTLPAAAQFSDSEAAAFLADMEPVLENQLLRLYHNAGDGRIAVADLANQTVWFSNPPQLADDPVANPLNKSRLASQVLAVLYSPSDQELLMDSFTNAVEKNQVESRVENDVLRVTYRMNNFERGEEDIPLVVGKERFERIFLDNVNEEERQMLLDRYSLREDEGVYRRFPLPAYLVEEFVEIMDKVGYTAEDLAIDNEQNAEILARLDPEAYDTTLQLRTLGPADSGRASVAVTVEYRLEDGELLVSVPADEIVEDPVYPLNAIRVLPFFGAAGPDSEGYMLVPDGSGALIYLNNGKTRYQPFQLPLYGNDMVNERRERRINTEQAFLPVYGIKQGDRAHVVEIERGSEIAEINADVAGRLHSYNWVAGDYSVRPRGRLTIGSGFQETTKLVFQDRRYVGDVELRVAFLYDDNADYSGMARWYRSRLAERRAAARGANPTAVDLSVQRPLVELIGGVEKQRSLLGVVVPYTEAATTFSQAGRMIEELASFGIQDVAVRYRGWFNDDIEHDFPGRLNIIGGLGGKRGFNELLGTAERYGTTIYPDVYFANVFSRGNGFSPRRDAARFLDQRIARLYRYNAATYQIATQHAPSFFLSPQRLEPTVDRFLKRYQDLSNNALSLADLARTVTSDFDEDDLFDRGGAVDSIVSQLQRFRSDLSDVMIDGANAYALPYADYVVQVPPGSSRFAITDESVPFLPLVLRGFSRFALEPINRANDLTDHFLKTLETGAEISFLWTWEDASVFKDTPYDHFYSTGFSNWLEDMVDYYQELSDVRRVIGNRDVVSHRRLESEVYQTVFEDGLTLYVNYGASAYSIDEFTVEADSYLLSRTDPSRQEAQRDR